MDFFLFIGNKVSFPQPIKGIKKLSSLLIKALYQLTSDFSFAKELLRCVDFRDIIFQINSLSRKVTLNETFETTADGHEPGKVYVAEVTVTCEKKTTYR